MSEVEVSLFGPGKGECVLLHLGFDVWVVVDSCRTQSGRPAALEYLSKIGVSPTRIQMVVATHWHDDHVGGLAELLNAAPDALFAYSAALDREAFLTLAASRELLTSTLALSTSASEMFEVFSRMRVNKRPRKLAIVDRTLMSRPPSSSCLGYAIEVRAPSDASVEEASARFAALAANQSDVRERVRTDFRNYSSVVLWVAVGDERILLGGDLVNGGGATRGWRAVVGSHDARGRATVFKVPHHGSHNGHLDRVWTEMLQALPIALLTPYNRGRPRLPRERDRRRICSSADRAFATSGAPVKAARRERPVERMRRRATVQIEAFEPEMGHIRLRKSLDPASTEWEVQLAGPARDLCLEGCWPDEDERRSAEQ